MATTAYAHIPDENMKILIALWTACFIYVDDSFLQDLVPIYEFQERFVRGISQEDPVLEAFAGITREIPAHLHRVAGNIFVASTLNGVTGVLLEKEMQGLKVSFCCSRYPAYSQSRQGPDCCCQISYLFSYYVNSSRSLCDSCFPSKSASQFLYTRYARSNELFYECQVSMFCAV
jgi:hypothetical protein